MISIYSRSIRNDFEKVLYLYRYKKRGNYAPPDKNVKNLSRLVFFAAFASGNYKLRQWGDQPFDHTG